MSDFPLDFKFPLDPALHEFLRRHCEDEGAYRYIVSGTQLDYLRANQRRGRPPGGPLPLLQVTGYTFNPAWMYTYGYASGWRETYRPGYHLVFDLEDGSEFGLLLYCNTAGLIDCAEPKDEWQTRDWLRTTPWVRDIIN